MTKAAATNETPSLDRVVSSARRFAELYFSREVDSLEASPSVPLGEARESWIVSARAGVRVLHVEVVVGPDDRVVTRRLDTRESWFV